MVETMVIELTKQRATGGFAASVARPTNIS